VVIGTVIDPEMSDSIRVTVVATGLGREMRPAVEQPNIRVVRSALGAAVQTEVQPANYTAYEQPTARRRVAAAGEALAAAEANFELLDIPAFLRRQAD
jgi:cell division protein FtsZ